MESIKNCMWARAPISIVVDAWPRAALAVAVMLCFGATGHAQSDPPEPNSGTSADPALAAGEGGFVTQLANIVGDEPEPGTRNWLYPRGPAANPFHRPGDPEYPRTLRRAQLGKLLFWDEQLSSDNTMACGTCHFPEAGGTDFRAGGAFPSGVVGSLGVLPQDEGGDYGDGKSASIDRRVTGRAAPTMIGAYVFNQLFWDLRAGPDLQDEGGLTIPGFEQNAGLEAQAVGPPVSDVEMAHFGISWSSGEIQHKLGQAFPLALASEESLPEDLAGIVAAGTTYDKLFDEAFDGPGGVTRERIAQAIAHYERTLVPNRAPIDVPNGMTKSQVNGFNHMKDNQLSCFVCHSATGNPQLDTSENLVNPFDQALSDGFLHFINLPLPGSFDGLVKTPTLRNLGLRRRFFHSGQFDDIDDVLAFYNGELQGAFPFFGFVPQLDEVQLAEVKDFLVNALTDPRVAQAEFPFDRPDLYGERVPFESNEFGSGTPGSGGLVPEILANAPAKAGSTHFKLGVGRGRAGAAAVLRLTLVTTSDDLFEAGPVLAAQVTTVLDAQGIGTAHLPLPADPDLVGRRLHARWAVVDPQAAGGLAFSDSAAFLIF